MGIAGSYLCDGFVFLEFIFIGLYEFFSYGILCLFADISAKAEFQSRETPSAVGVALKLWNDEFFIALSESTIKV